ncbi:MAG: hypothetical protein WC934_13605 [Acidithiobacillus sp.]|jgi:DNA-directed RNA polymerase subunit RPC12/RpoP
MAKKDTMKCTKCGGTMEVTSQDEISKLYQCTNDNCSNTKIIAKPKRIK